MKENKGTYVVLISLQQMAGGKQKTNNKMVDPTTNTLMMKLNAMV